MLNASGNQISRLKTFVWQAKHVLLSESQFLNKTKSHLLWAGVSRLY